jgi:hypothetical protein
VCRIPFLKWSDGRVIHAGCSHLQGIMKNYELSSKIGQCALCQNFGPSGHKCHYCPIVSSKDFSRLAHSHKVYTEQKLVQSQKIGTEQPNFQSYLDECKRLEETWKDDIRYIRGSSECVKYICNRCKDYTDPQALSQCIVCNALQPDYYPSGGRNQFSYWALNFTTLWGRLPS